jgi:hypothetical protein
LEPLRFVETEDKMMTPSHVSRRDVVTVRDGPETHVSVTHDALTSPAPRSRRTALIAAFSVAGLLVLVLALVLTFGQRTEALSLVCSVGPAASRLAATMPSVAASSLPNSTSDGADAGLLPEAAASSPRKIPPRPVPAKSELHDNPYGQK